MNINSSNYAQEKLEKYNLNQANIFLKIASLDENKLRACEMIFQIFRSLKNEAVKMKKTKNPLLKDLMKKNIDMLDFDFIDSVPLDYQAFDCIRDYIQEYYCQLANYCTACEYFTLQSKNSDFNLKSTGNISSKNTDEIRRADTSHESSVFSKEQIFFQKLLHIFKRTKGKNISCKKNIKKENLLIYFYLARQIPKHAVNSFSENLNDPAVFYAVAAEILFRNNEALIHQILNAKFSEKRHILISLYSCTWFRVNSTYFNSNFMYDIAKNNIDTFILDNRVRSMLIKKLPASIIKYYGLSSTSLIFNSSDCACAYLCKGNLKCEICDRNIFNPYLQRTHCKNCFTAYSIEHFQKVKMKNFENLGLVKYCDLEVCENEMVAIVKAWLKNSFSSDIYSSFFLKKDFYLIFKV